jgi:protein SCO1/2/putative membrane protein
VKSAYRLGILIVLATVLVSAGLCGAFVSMAPASPPRDAEDLEDAGLTLGGFRLTERSGRAVSDVDLGERVWVASFIFTHCPLSCPRITSVMKGLQGKLAGTSVLLVSISVDPDRDTPAVLADYARRFEADPGRWWFLTGPKDDVVRLVQERFKLGLAHASEGAVQAGAEAITHSDRLALVDRGNRVVAYFDSSDPAKLASLVAEASRRDRRAAAWVRRLPLVNASLNGTCTLLLIVGWWLIRMHNVRGHATVMILAVVTSALFLTSYLIYHFQAGSTPFRGAGAIRLVYFTILLSHTVLATFGVVPLLVLTLTRAARRQFDRHALIARVTFPIWLYVSVTGVLIYLMLYQLPIATRQDLARSIHLIPPHFRQVDLDAESVALGNGHPPAFYRQRLGDDVVDQAVVGAVIGQREVGRARR